MEGYDEAYEFEAPQWSSLAEDSDGGCDGNVDDWFGEPPSHLTHTRARTPNFPSSVSPSLGAPTWKQHASRLA